MMRRLYPLLVLLLLAASAHAAELSAEEILRRADDNRVPSADYSVLARVTSQKPNAEPKIGIYDVMAKGNDKSLIKTLAPAFEKGRLLLMRDSNLWAYLPNVSKPLRISLRERLIGEVANADIARVNFVGDYHPTIDRRENIDKKPYIVLDLKAKDGAVTYARVTLWVEAQTYRPFKAEFFGASGRLLKSCSYERYNPLGGKARPTRIVMNDPLVKGQQTVIEYAKMEVKELPEKYFTDDYMKKLSGK